MLAAAPVAALCAADSGSGETGKAAWTPLFNGKDLAGWKKPTGEAVATVEDGALVGTQTTGKGGDLFTEKEFDNFELRFTYKVVWPANSGVWFRGKYQFDILKYKNPVAFSGTLYCPGKMFITKNLKEELENRDGWNEGQRDEGRRMPRQDPQERPHRHPGARRRELQGHEDYHQEDGTAAPEAGRGADRTQTGGAQGIASRARRPAPCPSGKISLPWGPPPFV